MWYNKLNRMTVLRYPEPADVGGGDAGGVEPDAGGADATGGGESAADPWDFSADEAADADDAGGGEPAADSGESGGEPAADAEVYELELGEHYSGDEETTKAITAIAKESGVDAKGFSKALQGITQMLVERDAAKRAADLETLKGAWKGDFDKNMKQVRGVLRAEFGGEEMSRERMAALQSADVFRLVQRLASRVSGGEKGTALGKAAPAMSPAQEADDMLHNPANPLRDALFNPNHAQHKAAAERYNKLVGMQVFG